MGQKYAVFSKDGFPRGFYDSDIHLEIPQEAIPITEDQWLEFINNQNRRRWNFEKNTIEVYEPPPPTIDELKERLQKQLLNLEKQRLQEILDTYGYNGLADVQFYTNQNDAEAQGLLNWYKAYDDLIWNYIDNDLQALSTVDELLELDIRQVEQQIFEQSIQESPLP